MVIDLARYRIAFPQIKTFWERNQGRPISEFASRAAVASGAPIIVVYHYLGEIIGFNDEIKSAIERLKIFYRISEIIGVQEIKALIDKPEEKT
jgi:hypothetical protein